MKGAEFRETLNSLGLTQAEAARLFGFEQRSSRRWASGMRDVPYFLVIMLRMMASGTIDVHGVTHSQCGAETRAGTACQSPPVAGRKRCRLHGGLSPGAPRGSRNGNYRRGDWTKEAIEERRWLRSLVQAFAKTGTGQ